MSELMTFFVAVLLVWFLVWLFLYLPVIGFAYLYSGEFSLGLLHILPVLCLIGVYLFYHFVIEPKIVLRAALSRMYIFPLQLDKTDTAERWYNGFKKVVHDGIASTSDLTKQTDLNHCKRIVEKMTKDSIFNNFHRAFRLTGCHMEIKDSSGHSITKIV